MQINPRPITSIQPNHSEFIIICEFLSTNKYSPIVCPKLNHVGNMGMITHQLFHIVLKPRQVGKKPNGNEAGESKVKELVAEEWYNPRRPVLDNQTKGQGITPNAMHPNIEEVCHL